MTNAIYETPWEDRNEFETQFHRLTQRYQASYDGPIPIIGWSSEKRLPLIPKEFLNHLPEDVRSSVELLLDRLR